MAADQVNPGGFLVAGKVSAEGMICRIAGMDNWSRRAVRHQILFLFTNRSYSDRPLRNVVLAKLLFSQTSLAAELH